MDSDGHMNTTDSETIPLEAARERRDVSPDPERTQFHRLPNPSWSTDVADPGDGGGPPRKNKGSPHHCTRPNAVARRRSSTHAGEV